MIEAKAPGKMILIGEYAVLYGARSLVCAMDCYASVKLNPSNSNIFEITAPSLSVENLPFNINEDGLINFLKVVDTDTKHNLHFFTIIFEEVYNIIQIKNRVLQPMKIEINTNDFYSADRKNKYGFGSSAAMTVVLIQALLSFIDLISEFDTNEFFQLALQIHHKAQGNLGSGIDVAASVYGNVLTYQLDKKQEMPIGYCHPQRQWEDLQIIPIWIGHSTSTRQMVQRVDALKESSPKIFDQIMNELINCSERGCESYTSKNEIDFFESIRDYNKILSELSKQSDTLIISEAHQKLIDLLSSPDTVYKPSGAGGGDIGVAFCNSLEAVDKIKQALKVTEFQVLDYSIAKAGVVLSN